MKTVGIICEYNPYHNGHKRQIDILRGMGFERIVCVMSGNYTQRGELAIADKYTRAEAALRGGADIVLELPYPYSSLSAEGFARAGVHILSSVGVDAISFGSESADIDLLTAAADAISSPEFIEKYSQSVKGGAAKSFFSLLGEHIGRDCTILSNDILAIQYIAAIKALDASLDIVPIKRDGAAYNQAELNSKELPSATAIRRKIAADNAFSNELQAYMPSESLESISKATPVLRKNISREVIHFFRSMTPDEIATRAISRSGGGNSVADDGCGIVDRLCNGARGATSFNNLLYSAYNSRYTDARVNRVLLFSLFGVSDTAAKSLPEYTTLLAFSKNGQAFLSEGRKSRSFNIVTKPADAPCDSIQYSLGKAADEFYTLAMENNTPIDYFVKQSPFYPYPKLRHY